MLYLQNISIRVKDNYLKGGSLVMEITFYARLYLEFTKDFKSPIYALNFATSLSVLKTVNFFSKEKCFH